MCSCSCGYVMRPDSLIKRVPTAVAGLVFVACGVGAAPMNKCIVNGTVCAAQLRWGFASAQSLPPLGTSLVSETMRQPLASRASTSRLGIADSRYLSAT